MATRRKTPKPDLSDAEVDALFNGTPYQTHSATSLAGAVAAAPQVGLQNRQCYNWLAANPGNSHEGVYLGLRPSFGWKEGSVRRSMITLRQAGLIAPCGEVRNTTGQMAEAFQVCKPFPANGVIARGPGELAQANAEIARLRKQVQALEAQLVNAGIRPTTLAPLTQAEIDVNTFLDLLSV